MTRSSEATTMRQRNLTEYDMAVIAGRKEGRRLATLELIEAMLETKFGKLTEASLTTLRSKTNDELRDLGIRLTQVSSLTELGF
jgi:hypothetical protein